DGGGRSRRPGRLSTPRRGRVGLHARGGEATGVSSSSGAMRGRCGRGGSGRGRGGSRGRSGSGERTGGGDIPAATEIATTQNNGDSGSTGQDASNVPFASSASPGGVEGEGEATPPVQTKDTAAAAAAAATDSSAAVAMEVDANDATGRSPIGNGGGSEEKKEDNE
ncbi:unnamed protein product, partial [Ectocarpus sp. 8 AP-2014]